MREELTQASSWVSVGVFVPAGRWAKRPPIRRSLTLEHGHAGAPDEYYLLTKILPDDVEVEPILLELLTALEKMKLPDGDPIEIQVRARVTDEAPGFGFNVSASILSRMSSLGSNLDVSVYAK